MRKRERVDSLPGPIKKVGLLTDEMDNARQRLRDKVAATDVNLANMLAVPPEVWECDNVQELGTAAHLDDCELMCLRDRPNNRYYLVAMSADPERARGTIEDTEYGIDIVEATGPIPSLILYYCSIDRGRFREWQHANMEQRLGLIKAEAARNPEK